MYKLLAGAALALGASAQSMNLTQLLASQSQLTSLVGLLQKYPNIASQVGSAKNVTLFAPNNAAIAALASSGTLTTASESEIGDLLMYHILPEQVYASQINSTPAFVHTDLTNSTYSNVTGGQVVGVASVDNSVLIESGLKLEAQVVKADLNYTGGVVHIIDQVLTIPLNCSTTAVAADLTAFAGALSAANLLDTVDGLKDVTVFAPANSAFVSIGSALGNLSTSQLTSILKYHIIQGTIAYAPSIGNGSVTSLEGSKLNLTVIDGAIFVNAARVINSDILVSGGVIHVIDSVLNPNSTQKADASVTSAVVAYSGASSASLGALTSGISTASSVNSALTQTTDAVASGYSTQTGGAVGTGAGGAMTTGGSSSSSGVAALPTGMVGAAALFGGAALVANW